MSESSGNSEKSDQRKSEKTALPNSWISALFLKFHGIYLSKWVSAIDGIEKQAVEEWAKGLHGLTGDDLKIGLDRCRGLEWPPSIKEFRMLCAPEKDAHKTNAGAYKQFKSLPRSKADKAKSRSNLNEMKILLRQKP